MGKDILCLLRFISIKGMFVQGFLCIKALVYKGIFLCEHFCV